MNTGGLVNTNMKGFRGDSGGISMDMVIRPLQLMSRPVPDARGKKA